MLEIVREKARKQRIRVGFVKSDMRSIPFKDKFDLVTCWYDSLNYLLKQEDLRKTFKGVAKALRPDGLFVFDMNTEHALSVIWQQQPTRIQQDTSDIFEVHQPSYDTKQRVATLRITAFVKGNGKWSRVGETHQERAYSLAQIRQCLKSAGLSELACWGSIRKMTQPRRDSGRLWLVCSKGQ